MAVHHFHSWWRMWFDILWGTRIRLWLCSLLHYHQPIEVELLCDFNLWPISYIPHSEKLIFSLLILKLNTSFTPHLVVANGIHPVNPSAWETSFPLLMDWSSECGIVTTGSRNHRHQSEGSENGRRVSPGRWCHSRWMA